MSRSSAPPTAHSRSIHRGLLLLLAAVLLPGCSPPMPADDLEQGTPRGPVMETLGWTADGAEVLFTYTEPGDGPCVRTGVYRADGRSAPRPVLTGEAWCRLLGGEVRSSLSADGRTVYAYQDHDAGECTGVLALEVETARWRQVRRVCGVWVEEPAVSPDGRRIAFRRECGHETQPGGAVLTSPRGCVDQDGGRLTVMELDGSGQRVVGEPNDLAPVWAADGRTLAVRRWRSDSIVVVDLPTGRRRMVTRGLGPSFSPDGEWLAFTRHGGRPGAPSTLQVIRTDGTGERTLFRQRRGDLRGGWRNSGWPDAPRWSPDGRRIAFTRHFPGGGTLWVVDADGTGLRPLVEGMETAE